MTATLFSTLALAMAMTLCRGQGQDFTMTPGARGSQVVDAVVNRIRSRCVFHQDRLFLRRVAYVMSRDGINSDTYRSNFNGGIWQITEPQFLTTQDCTNHFLQDACNTIQTEFNIDWPIVSWSDLRKPLYSGLAAALSTLLELAGADMPGSVADQADLWVRMYGGDANTFSSVAEDATRLEDCWDKLDVVFLLDASDSVSASSFPLMTQFAADVVEVMNVSSDTVRVADIVFSSKASLHFGLSTYSTKAQVKAALLQTPKRGGATSTSLALSLAAWTLSSGVGARPYARTVAVLITDGRSTSTQDTVAAAQTLKNQGTTVFAIGVGNYNLRELQDVASDPVCWHVLTLTSFDQINLILTQIQKSICEASYRFSEGQDVKRDIPQDGEESTTVTNVPHNTSTIEAEVSCGILDIYVSTTHIQPGPAVYDSRYQAAPDSPAVLSMVETLPQGTPVYVTVVGTRLPPSVAALSNCSDYRWRMGVTP